jgi:hypothetical protein
MDFYQNEVLPHEYQDMPISFLLIKLMELLKLTENKTLITKALIITISFFEQIPPDIYDNQGIELDLLPLKVKKNAISQLNQEFQFN